MSKPDFKNGYFTITDYANRKLELPQHAWNHIIEERRRSYFERFFDKLEQTLQKPTTVKKSTKMPNVVIYERLFDDFYVTDTFFARAYINVIVNWKTQRILTAYSSKKAKKGRILWPRKR